LVFGWQGFSLEHPDDWGPVTLTGTRKEGYVRITSPGRLGLQIRWKEAAGPGELKPRLFSYFDRLARDAKRAKVEFRREHEEDGERLTYRYNGTVHARGALFFSPPCGRVFFLEVVSSRNESFLVPFRQMLGSFQSFGQQPLETWSVLGLQVHLPPGLLVEKRQFLAGRTQLMLSKRGVQVLADRWGFGEQLIQKHGLEAWAAAALAMPRPEIKEEGCGLRLVQKGSLLKPRREALVMLDIDQNQITTLTVASRQSQWRPQWDWLT
jgi:hypothetical protein